MVDQYAFSPGTCLRSSVNRFVLIKPFIQAMSTVLKIKC